MSAISESELLKRVGEARPDLLYLSLPNNPTGATFDPEVILSGVVSDTAVLFDLTLPSAEIDVAELSGRLAREERTGHSPAEW